MTAFMSQVFMENNATDWKSEPLHVALVTETWPPEINGVANSVFELAKGLVARGYRVSLVRPAQKQQHSESNALFSQVFVRPFKIPKYTSLQFGKPAYFQLKKTFKTIKPDIVHVVTEGPLGLAALLAARRLGVAVSSGYHSQFHDFSDHFGLTALVKPITQYLKVFHNRCDVTCVPSVKSQKELASYGVRRLAVVGRGVDTERFNPKHRSEDLRKTWGVSSHTTVLLYVGRVSPEKNIELVVKGYQELCVSTPNRDVKLVIVGDGPDLKRLRRMVPEAHFAGAKTGLELSQHYASADCFVFASEVETFGNVVTEAMASGLAIVAYDDAAAATYVDNSSGWRIPLSNAQAFIDTVASLPAQSTLHNMGKAAHLRVQDLGWALAVEQFESAFVAALKHNHENNPRPTAIHKLKTKIAKEVMT